MQEENGDGEASNSGKCMMGGGGSGVKTEDSGFDAGGDSKRNNSEDTVGVKREVDAEDSMDAKTNDSEPDGSGGAGGGKHGYSGGKGSSSSSSAAAARDHGSSAASSSCPDDSKALAVVKKEEGAGDDVKGKSKTRELIYSHLIFH